MKKTKEIFEYTLLSLILGVILFEVGKLILQIF